MQLLAAIHVVFTCSFVLLLAYVLSRIFSYLASSVINGPGKSRRPTDDDFSRSRSRSRRLRQIEEEEEEAEEAELMTKLQERLQEEDGEDEYGDAVQTQTVVGLAPKYEVGDSIFDDVIAAEEELSRDYVKPEASWNDDEEGMDGGMNMATDRGKGEDEEEENGNERVWDMNQGIAGEGEGRGDASTRVLSSVDKLKKDHDEEEDKEEKGNGSKLGDAQGSTSSPLPRLPPTWSDLERIVNMSSKNLSSPPSMSTLDED